MKIQEYGPHVARPKKEFSSPILFTSKRQKVVFHSKSLAHMNDREDNYHCQVENGNPNNSL